MIGFSFPVVPQGPGAHPHADVGRALRQPTSTARSTRSREVGHERHRDRCMSNMKALVKAKRRAGPLDGGRAGARDRPERRADRVRRPRSAAPTSTSTTGTRGRRRPSPCRWSSATSSSARSPQFGAAVTGLKVGQRVSGEGHIICGHCRNCRAGRRASLPQHARRRRQPAGRLRRISSCIPALNVVPIPDDIADEIAAILDPLGNAVHTALSLRSGRRGRADHRRRPDRHHGARRSRNTSARATSSSPTSTGYRLDAGRRSSAPAVSSTCRSEKLRDVMPSSA